MTACLASLAQLRGPAVAAVFGPPQARAEDAVASDPYGCRVELALEPAEPVPDTEAHLARSHTYDAEHMLVVRAVAFARMPNHGVPKSAYSRQLGDDPGSLDAQVVLLARRLFDACPEADMVEAELWQAHRKPMWVSNHYKGTKTLRAGVLPRGRAATRSIAFQAAVSEALSSENWTTRLRQQAEIARELVILMHDIPLRLRRIDNSVVAVSGRPRYTTWPRA
jgi:hypothetical protein